jgi:hypothetical protein
MSKAALKPPPAADLYERDFFAWPQVQAEVLRAGRFDELDLRQLIDEVAIVGAVRSARSRVASTFCWRIS